MDKQMSG